MLLRYYAAMVRDRNPEERRLGLLGGSTLVRREPIGVAGAIVPWNYPQFLAAFKYAPALAAGCTVVIKPSPETVLDSYLLAEAVEEADLPAGVVSIVPGGAEIGADRGVPRFASWGGQDRFHWVHCCGSSNWRGIWPNAASGDVGVGR